MINSSGEEEQDESEDMEDEEAALADDLLDEVGDDTDADASLEGFGILPETDADEDEEAEEDEHGEGDDLEEDAEDVDFDRFDDVDEM